jgi:hypothetical protein
MREAKRKMAPWSSCDKCGRPIRNHGGRCRPCKEALVLEADRFWAKVQTGDGCWSWLAAVDRGGYGVFQRSRPHLHRYIKAPRYMWELTHGQIPYGLLVCHICDNPRCVNPAHLFLGTQADNIADAKAKGRLRGHPFPRGSANGVSKLTEHDVRTIRRLHAGGLRSRKRLAARFGVCKGSIQAILERRTWAWLD